MNENPIEQLADVAQRIGEGLVAATRPLVAALQIAAAAIDPETRKQIDELADTEGE